MSCEAVKNAVQTASPATSHGAALGSKLPITPTLTRITSWVSSIQPRRRPPQGKEKRSITGAQTNLKLNGRCTQAKKPIVAMSTSNVSSHAVIVLPVSGFGSPDEKPRPSISARRGSRNASQNDGLFPGSLTSRAS